MNQVTNQVMLIGNLGHDPTIFGNGDHPGIRFDLATNEVFGTDDNRSQRTDWHRVVCWGGLVNSAKHLSKGDKIALAGKLRSNDFVTKNATKRRVIEVHASSIEFINVKSLQNALRAPEVGGSNTATSNVDTHADSEDDIPF